MGLLEMIASTTEIRAQLETAAQVKKLTLPMEMGELFKVMALTRGVETPLTGFGLRDARARL
jgi:SAM-dependent MidA family methyltransferase